jgi:hypothetical protein
MAEIVGRGDRIEPALETPRPGGREIKLCAFRLKATLLSRRQQSPPRLCQADTVAFND